MKDKKSKYIVDAVKMAYQLGGKTIPAIAALSLLSSFKPFISLLLTSFVIDGLTAQMTFGEIILPTLLGITAIFAANLLTNALSKYREAMVWPCYMKYNSLTGEKSLSLDYQQLEDAAVTQLRDRMNRDSNWGSGIANTYWYFESMLSGIFGLVFSILLLRPLITEQRLFQTWLTPVFLAGMAVCIAAPTLFKMKFVQREEQEFMNKKTTLGAIVNHIVWSGGDYKNGKDIRIYNVKPLIKHYITTSGFKTENRRQMLRVSRASGLGGGFEQMGITFIEGLAYIFVSILAFGGKLTIGSVIRCAGAMKQFAQGVSGLVSNYSYFVIDTQRLQSKFEYLALPTQFQKGTLTTEKRADNDYALEFRNVSFKYPGAETYALKNLNLKFTIGQRMAVVGMNGSGKTTMIKLLCRLYDPTEGEITLNGIDIKKYEYDEYLGIFSVVFQDFKLFSFPLGQNVAASVSYDPVWVEKCLEMAGFGDRLDDMPQGLNTPLYKNFEEDGVEISGGEAQKIALARALYKNAPFIVLDEPTAALDPIAEFEIYSKFNEIVGGKTAIYISHRLSSCRFCDDIAVFHEGELIQRGSHDTLLSDTVGKYYELWNAQAQYYTEKAV